MAVELTLDQRTAVENRGGSLLVSAAAGSGKTKVLVERLFRYIMEEQCAVDDFLIITYTKAAAAELRGKIAAELSKRVAEHPDNAHLRRQLFRVYQADIKTVDAFCAALLRENVYRLPPVAGHTLTPDFRVLDEQEAAMVKERVLERTLEDFYAGMDDQRRQLAETLGAGRDDRALEQLVLELHRKLQSHPYPLEWLEKVRRGWETLPEDLSQTPYGRIIMEDAAAKADFWAALLEKTADGITDEVVAAAYSDRLVEAAAGFRGFSAACGDWNAMAAALPGFHRRMGAVRGENPEKEHVQAIVKQCKDDLKKLAAPFTVTQAEHLSDLSAMAPAMLALTALTADFSHRYQAEKARRNALDFSDQEHYAIDLLCQPNGQPTELAQQVAQRYREIMVDEYQDANDVQNCIFSAVSRQEQNLFTVGDVKQSIYRFRQADPSIFRAKLNAWAPLPSGTARPRSAEGTPGTDALLALDANFRSAPQVVEGINFLFEQLMTPQLGDTAYGDGQRLVCGAPGEYEGSVEACFLSDDTAETDANYIADHIETMVSSGEPVRDGGTTRPVQYEDCCVLLAARGDFPAYAEALTARGIPVYADARENLLDAPHIRPLIALLRVIDNPAQDIYLAAAMLGPMFGFTDDDLVRLRAGAQSTDQHTRISLYGAVLQAARSGAEDDFTRRVGAFYQRLAALRRMARSVPVEELLEEIFVSTGYLAALGAMENGQRRREDARRFAAFCAGAGAGGISALVRAIDAAALAGSTGQEPTPGGARPGCVTIMTIHLS